MPRVTHVKAARKSQGTCGKCGAKIKKGSPYLWWKFRFGGRRVRCPNCPPRPSDLTQSEFAGTLYDLQDRVGDACKNFRDSGNIDDLKSEIENIADEVRTLGEECEEKRNNMPDSLQDSDSGSLLQERADFCESAASEFEGLDLDPDAELLDADGNVKEEERDTIASEVESVDLSGV